MRLAEVNDLETANSWLAGLGFSRAMLQSHRQKHAEILTGKPDGLEYVAQDPLPFKLIVIGCTSRCGSTLLCDLIEQMGTFGAPAEHINFADTQRILKDLQRDNVGSFRNYLTLLYEQFGGDGFLPIKTGVHGVVSFVQNGFAQHISDWHWIYLRREDLLGQAISMIIAKHTEAWRSSDLRKGEPVFNREQIDLFIKQFSYENMLWERFFSLIGAAPYRTTYEWYTRNAEQFSREFAQRIGYNGDISVPSVAESKIRSQRTDVNARFADLFLHGPAAQTEAL